MRLAQVLVFAKDLSNMHAFYRDALGLPTIDDSRPTEVIRLDAGGVVLALHAIPPVHASKIVISDPPKARADTPVKLIFQVDDVRAARDKLSSQGAQLRELCELEGDRLTCDCLDPEGNVFRIANR